MFGRSSFPWNVRAAEIAADVPSSQLEEQRSGYGEQAHLAQRPPQVKKEAVLLPGSSTWADSMHEAALVGVSCTDLLCLDEHLPATAAQEAADCTGQCIAEAERRKPTPPSSKQAGIGSTVLQPLAGCENCGQVDPHNFDRCASKKKSYGTRAPACMVVCNAVASH